MVKLCPLLVIVHCKSGIKKRQALKIILLKISKKEIKKFDI